MTTAHAPRQRLTDDAAISAAVLALLGEHGETVNDLSYHTRISPASLYRKLGGQASWKAADIGAVARHFRLLPGDLFFGPAVLGRPRRHPDEGPDGDDGCAIRDSNPEPADLESPPSVFLVRGNYARSPHWAPPHPRVAAEQSLADRWAA